MTSSNAQEQNPQTVASTEQSNKLPRLFNFDLPALLQTGQAWPEQDTGVSIQRVLDIATGSGQWVINAARVHPHIQFLGIESDLHLLEQARTQAQTQGIENVSFQAASPFELQDQPAASYDLVNARYIVGLLSASDWPRFLQETVRLTRPGGIIRLTETDLPISNGTGLEQLSAWIAQAFCQTGRSFAPDGILLSMTPALKPLLQEAGCQQVQETVTSLNFSAGMPAHETTCADLARTYQQILPFLLQAKVAEPSDIEQTYQQMLNEMQSEDFVALAFSLTAWGIRA